ncbi:MAG: hypothetical protein JSU70_02985 [Phycisphaerales bacterium]|nr:MAG: hypothetical protein JSU70_02985 [Phycisphaerales bacterium]
MGSSSICMWQTHKYFPDLPVINRGFGGSQIFEVNYFAGRIVIPTVDFLDLCIVAEEWMR